MNVLIRNTIHVIGSIVSSGLCVAIAHNALNQEPPLVMYGISWFCLALMFIYHALRKH